MEIDDKKTIELIQLSDENEKYLKQQISYEKNTQLLRKEITAKDREIDKLFKHVGELTANITKLETVLRAIWIWDTRVERIFKKYNIKKEKLYGWVK